MPNDWGLVRVHRGGYIGSRQDRENERLDESNQALEGIHNNKQGEPCDRRQAGDEVHRTRERE